MAYAVFDWDNTIRKGFTLFSWMDYLYEEKILDTKVKKSIACVQDQYAQGRINHDEYAEIACEVYAAAMKGMSKEKRDMLIRQYLKFDKQSLMPFSVELFGYMNYYNISPIIISGAPQYIVEQYRDMFGLAGIYAFDEKYDMGFCTGDVSHNYGVDKKKTLEKLCEVFGEKPLVGFGDSYSDIPLFKMSKYAFCIVKAGDEKNKLYGKDVIYVSDATNGNQIKILLQNILRLRKTKQ